MTLKTIACFFIYLFFCLSCAKQSAPSGGPKDTIPPRLVQSFPVQKQVNFKGKKIELVFSEMVVINNAKEQIIITPSVGKDFDAITKNKGVTLAFEKPFADSTTYTINFREAIQDITEKNPAKNLQLAFSTGSYIDSLSISGNVYDIAKTTQSKDATIALYHQTDTFNIFKHKPSYITKTNDKGFFIIENLKPDTYHIYAFEDRNKNLVVDSKNESYGFLIDTIKLTKNTINLAVPLVRLDSRPLKLTSARPYNNYFNIRTAKSLSTYTITTADGSNVISNYGDDRANVKVYNTLSGIDSLKINFSAYDSLNQHLDTTLYVKFSKRDVEPEKFTMALSDTKVKANEGILETKITFNKPIKLINFDSLFYQPDSTNTFRYSEKDLNWDFSTNTLTLKKNIDKKILQKEPPVTPTKATTPSTTTDKNQPPKKIIKNQLTIAKGTFISIDGDSSSAKTEAIRLQSVEETGVIIVKIKTNEKAFIIQLLSQTFVPIESVKNTKDVKFENLNPSNYMIKLIIDKNGNGKWDPGNIFEKKEPEPITFYKTEKKEMIVNLKANWELGPLLITY
jgi:uncharacterized protein (DUF2141 family)